MFNLDLFKFDTPAQLALGLVTGIVFGVLLQRARVTRYATIVGQFLWKDHTVIKTMLTAVAVGSVGVYAMHQMWDVPLHVKAAEILAVSVGGVIFGVGMALLGYCPGTGMAAIGEGSRHAIPGVIGMLTGAAIYAEVYPWFKAHVLPVANLGKVTFADITGVSIWVFVVALIVLASVVFYLLRNRGGKTGDKTTGTTHDVPTNAPHATA
ncbi:MAG: YeeE/YedE family protein [Phycisphaera sp.]|nr:YeeE/YedE family protein [Phycisphaera sp.]